MKKIIKLALCAATLLMMNNISLNKDNTFIETTHLYNNNGINIKRIQFGDNEEVKTSKIYTQCALLENGSSVLRFAMAVKGNVDTITFSRSEVLGLDNTIKEEKTIEVDTVYKGISVGEYTYYYSEENQLTKEDNDSYYWACYTINYSSETTLDKNNIEITAKVNDKVIETTKASLVGTKYLDTKPNHTHSFINKRTTPGVFYTLCEACGTIDNVIHNYVQVTSIDNIEKELELEIGEEYQLNPTISPENATFKDNIEYTSDNEEVATVDKNGKITALKPGVATIKVKCDAQAPKCYVIVGSYDQYLVTDTKGTLSNVTKDTDIPSDSWYTKNPASKSNPFTMEKGVITGTIGKAITSDTTPYIAVRYLPKDEENNIYKGDFFFKMTVTNNTANDLNFTYELGNVSKNVIIKKEASFSFSIIFTSDGELAGSFVGLKFKKPTLGTIIMDSIYYIPLANN